MENMISFVHDRISKKKYDNGIDFTMGNGHDTLFLSDYCHKVYSYDIQKEALDHTRELIKGKDNVLLHLKSHELFDQDVDSFDVGIFNLGYLPGGSKEITTEYETTLKTLKKAVACLRKKGVIYIVVYTGHDLGKESAYLMEYFLTLDHMIFNVARFEMMNKENAPYVVMIEKR